MTAADKERELGKAMLRLEKWWEGHKRHSLSIDLGNRYGATCWTVRLTGVTEKRPEHWYFDKRSPSCGEIFAEECAFFKEYSKSLPTNVVFAASNDDDAWPFVGLAATIHAAIDKAEELGDD